MHIWLVKIEDKTNSNMPFFYDFPKPYDHSYKFDDRNMRVSDKKRDASSSSSTPLTALAPHNMDRHHQPQQHKDHRASTYSYNHPSPFNHPKTSVAHDHVTALNDNDDRLGLYCSRPCMGCVSFGLLWIIV